MIFNNINNLLLFPCLLIYIIADRENLALGKFLFLMLRKAKKIPYKQANNINNNKNNNNNLKNSLILW